MIKVIPIFFYPSMSFQELRFIAAESKQTKAITLALLPAAVLYETLCIYYKKYFVSDPVPILFLKIVPVLVCYIKLNAAQRRVSGILIRRLTSRMLKMP